MGDTLIFHKYLMKPSEIEYLIEKIRLIVQHSQKRFNSLSKLVNHTIKYGLPHAVKMSSNMRKLLLTSNLILNYVLVSTLR